MTVCVEQNIGPLTETSEQSKTFCAFETPEICSHYVFQSYYLGTDLAFRKSQLLQTGSQARAKWCC